MSRFIIIIITGLFIFFTLVQAEKSKQPVAPESKPFAEHFVVFHISSSDESTQELILNNVQNLSQHYGIDNIAIEVVAFGAGLNLLFKENKQSKRIKSLAAGGVRFSACGNTMKKMKRKESDLVSVATEVRTGVARIIELQEAGWSYVRP